MASIEDELAALLKQMAPEPPHAIDPEPIISAGRAHRRAWLVAPAAAAAIVLAVVALVAVVLHRPGSRPVATGPSPTTAPVPTIGTSTATAVPPPPAGYRASEFRLASTQGATAKGPPPTIKPYCEPGQITAVAATRRTVDGVLGVIRIRGDVLEHQHGQPVRCWLPVQRGPSTLLGADGRILAVPLSKGDSQDPPSNVRPDLAMNNGMAVWGFGWFGSYCGPRATALELLLPHGKSIRVPLRGPQPSCASGGSVLIDGIPGWPGQPVQPARPTYAQLRLSGHIENGTTSDRVAPIQLTLRTVGTTPVPLDPCPAYSSWVFAAARNGGFGGTYKLGSLPCTQTARVIRPGHPLRFTVGSGTLDETALSGSTVHVDIGIAGVPPLKLTTRVR